MEFAIETHGLTKRFGARTALDGIDLRVPRGSAFGFLGPNGAGKTTIIRTLLGLTAANAGTMEVLGYPVPLERAQALRRVGAIVEEPRFHPEPDRSREPAPRRGRARSRDPRADRAGAGARRSVRPRRKQGQELLDGHAPATRGRALPAGRPAAADPRRAHQRARSGWHPGVPGNDPRDGRAGGQDGVHLLAPARRGRKDLRRGRDRRSRQGDRAGLDRRARPGRGRAQRADPRRRRRRAGAHHARRQRARARRPPCRRGPARGARRRSADGRRGQRDARAGGRGRDALGARAPQPRAALPGGHVAVGCSGRERDLGRGRRWRGGAA